MTKGIIETAISSKWLEKETADCKFKDKRLEKRFKAVRLALSSSHPIVKTMRDLNIKENTLYSWVSS